MPSSEDELGPAYALIIATDSYSDPEFRKLRAPQADAEQVRGVLEDPAIGGYSVETLMNEPERVLRVGVEDFFARRRLNDRLVLYFSGHGIKDEEGRLYFVTSTTEVAHLAATGISADFVREQMERCRSQRILLVLDCCYSGAYRKSYRYRASERVNIRLLAGRGKMVISACAAEQYSFEIDSGEVSGEARPSIFTAALVQGLRDGDADRDGDGFISVDELYDYIYDQVRAETTSQTPEKWGEARGRFIIARSPHSPTAPEIAEATRLAPDERVLVPGVARLSRRWRQVTLAVSAAAAVIATGLTFLLTPGAGTATPPPTKISTSGADISSVQFSGDPGNYTVTIAGTGFGSPTVSLPYYGFLPNFRISDDEQASHGEWGYTGDSVPLAYRSWSNNKIVIAGIGAGQGDALELAVWNNTTRAGASWGGNVPPVLASAPVIQTVSASGATSNPAVTIKGSGFGPAPVAMPFTGQLKNLVISDWRTDPNGAVPPDTWTTGVTERFTSWADNEIQISGFAGTFGHGSNVLRPGDPLTIRISSTQGKSLAGPQTAWGGRLSTAPTRPTVSPANPPLAAAKTAYVVNSASDTVTPISTVTGQAGPAIPVGPKPGAIAITPNGKTAYVGPADFSPSPALIPISTTTNKAGPAIPLTGDSFIIAITPDGKTVYVASSSYGTVTPISTATNKAGPPIPTGVVISAIAITPDSKTVYVTGVTGPDPSGKVIPIPTATNRPGPAIPVGKNPAAIVITPNGSTAYVLNTGSRSVTPISTVTNKPGLPILAGADPAALAITPDGKTAYVVNDTTLGTVTPISLATNTPGPAISVGDHPDAIAITPDGKTAWVANVFSSTLTPVSTAINTAGPPIYIDSGTHDIAITPDGKTVYVTNGAGPSGAVTPVNTVTHQAGPAIKVGDQPTSIAITPY